MTAFVTPDVIAIVTPDLIGVFAAAGKRLPVGAGNDGKGGSAMKRVFEGEAQKRAFS